MGIYPMACSRGTESRKRWTRTLSHHIHSPRIQYPGEQGLHSKHWPPQICGTYGCIRIYLSAQRPEMKILESLPGPIHAKCMEYLHILEGDTRSDIIEILMHIRRHAPRWERTFWLEVVVYVRDGGTIPSIANSLKTY